MSSTEQDTERQLEQYKRAQIETATPEQLLLMLYDGAIKYLTVAKEALGENNYQVSHQQILKAEAIVLELMSVLDMDVGGELALNLYNLYDFMYRHLIQANLQKSTTHLDDVMALLHQLRGAWQEAGEIVGQMKADGQFTEQVGERHFEG